MELSLEVASLELWVASIEDASPGDVPVSVDPASLAVLLEQATPNAKSGTSARARCARSAPATARTAECRGGQDVRERPPAEGERSSKKIGIGAGW
jgi:hypothetical protein